MVNQWSVPENLDRFRRMLVYRGAGLGRFIVHQIQQDLSEAATLWTKGRLQFSEVS